MSYETLLYAVDGAIATITLNRPESLNTIVPPMPDELQDAVLRAGARRVGVGAAITEASNPEEATLALKDRLRRAWNEDPRMEAVTAAAFGTSPRLDLSTHVEVPETDLHL